MKINNKMIGLSLVVAASLLTGCVKDTLFDEQSPKTHNAKVRSIYSNITELEVVLEKDTPQEEFDRIVIETLGNKKNLSANEISQLFETVGKTKVTSNLTIFSADKQPFEYTKPVSGYPILNTVNAENKAVLKNDGYYSNITISGVGENQFNIKSKITKIDHQQKTNFEYLGLINQSETYPTYISKEDNNTYKVILIQVQKINEKRNK